MRREVHSQQPHYFGPVANCCCLKDRLMNRCSEVGTVSGQRYLPMGATVFVSTHHDIEHQDIEEEEGGREKNDCPQ